MEVKSDFKRWAETFIGLNNDHFDENTSKWFSNLCSRYSDKKIDENLYFLFCRTRFHRGSRDFF